MKLGVNVDHVATLRQARQVQWPSPLEAALVAQRAGADQITVHLREDRRHIQDQDVRQIRAAIAVPLNLEMASIGAMVSFANDIKPATVTLVPERREEVTTEGGLNLAFDTDQLRLRIRMMQEQGIRVSVFIDPEVEQVKLAHKLDCDAIELHTGDFAHTVAVHSDWSQELEKLDRAARLGAKLGMYVAAGHGLTAVSTPIVCSLDSIEELNIGHALIADSVFEGLGKTVKKYKQLSQKRSQRP